MWYDILPKKPAFIRQYNSKKKGERMPNDVHTEEFAWNCNDTYNMHRCAVEKFFYEREYTRQTYKLYEPTGYMLPALIYVNGPPKIEITKTVFDNAKYADSDVLCLCGANGLFSTPYLIESDAVVDCQIMLKQATIDQVGGLYKYLA